MIEWTDLIHRFDGPGGPIAVNGDAERWCVNRLDLDAVRLAVEDALVPPGEMPAKAWVGLCRDLPLSGDPAEFRKWIQTIVVTPTDPRRVAASRPMRLLGALRFHDVLLWPTVGHLLPHPCEPGRQWKVPYGRTTYERTLLCDMLVGISGINHFLLSCSPIGSADEVCEAALLRVLEVAATSGHWQACKKRGGGLVLFRSLEGVRRSDGSAVAIMGPAQDLLHRNKLFGRVASRYGDASARADACPWIEAYGRASAHSRRKSGYAQDRAWAVWLEYLASLGSMPAPSAITREDHILGTNGFLAWLPTRADPSGHGYRRKLSHLRELMVAMVVEGSMPKVPIDSNDVLSRRRPTANPTRRCCRAA